MTATAGQSLRLYDVENVVAFASSVLERRLARNGGFLSAEQREDAHSHLVEQSLILARVFRPGKVCFSTYLSFLLHRRLVDWYREELGDNRTKTPRPELVSFESLSRETPMPRAPDELEEVLVRTSVA